MSSASFPSLELHCRPSAWLRAAVLLLAGLAAVSVMLSALPAASVLLVPLLGILAWRGAAAHAGLELRFGGDGTLLVVEGATGTARRGALLGVEERGPLLVVAVRVPDGKAMQLCFGPDTAADAVRRSLRLWQQRHCGTDDGALAALGLH